MWLNTKVGKSTRDKLTQKILNKVMECRLTHRVISMLVFGKTISEMVLAPTSYQKQTTATSENGKTTLFKALAWKSIAKIIAFMKVLL